MTSRLGSLSAAALLLLLVGWLDYVTGRELGFFVFYFLPISIAAWYRGSRMALLFAVAASIVWFIVERLNGFPFSSELFRYWNGGVRLVAFVILALIMSRIRLAIDREKELNEELSQRIAEVKQLSGLLPICANCKNIRDDKGYWHQVESYVRQHSDARFSHSICPPCMKELYPDFEGKSPQQGQRA